MDYPWWTYGASDEFELDNGYSSSYDPYTFLTQYEYIYYNHCGDKQYSEQYPHVSTMDYSKQYPHNHFSWNHEYSLSWNPNQSFPSYAHNFKHHSIV